MDEELIAPCGMNCALCVAYQAQALDLKRKGFSRSYCAGCRPRGKHCAFMKGRCAKIGEGLIHDCSECGDFPCARLKRLDKRYRTQYHLSMIDNLRQIKAVGMDRFLVQQAADWRCPRCGGTICCHIGLCLECDLEKWRQNRTSRWGER